MKTVLRGPRRFLEDQVSALSAFIGTAFLGSTYVGVIGGFIDRRFLDRRFSAGHGSASSKRQAQAGQVRQVLPGSAQFWYCPRWTRIPYSDNRDLKSRNLKVGTGVSFSGNNSPIAFSNFGNLRSRGAAGSSGWLTRKCSYPKKPI